MPGETLSDRYLIERKLGSGGAAEVLLAADTILRRQVAIKRLHGWLSADREARVRFQQEAQAFARLTHPHIVALFDVGEDNNRPYLVMEYLEGETLRKIIAAEGPFHPDDIAVVIEHIGEALDYAHRRGVVHRDIKPENVLVDRHGVVKVVDFGIAKVLEDATITQAGLAPGTAQYISPEQAQGHPVTSASDIYSLGVVAYEMLAGRPPFAGDSAVAVATQHVNKRPPSPSDVNPLAPRLASEIILRALAKTPGDRYASAGEFAQAMLHWKDTTASAARPVPSPEPQPTVRIPTKELASDEIHAPVPGREDVAPRTIASAASGLGRAGIGMAAILALFAVGAILWLLLDDGNSGTATSTATVGAVAGPDDGDATEVPAPTDVPASTATVEPPTVVPTLPAAAAFDLMSLDLIGRPADDVFADLTARGVSVERRDVTSTEFAEEQVVAFSAVEVEPGDTVTVDVSMGDRAQIPANLQRLPLDEAMSALSDRGFVTGTPLPVSREQIQSQLGDGAEFPFEDQQVVGIQNEGIAFGAWVATGSTVQLVYYDAGLDE